MKSFSNETLNFFFRKFLVSYISDLAKTVRALRILQQKSTEKLWNKRALSNGEPCTCECVTLLQSFHRGTLSTYLFIAQNFQSTFYMTVLFRRSSKTTMFSRFLKRKFSVSLKKDFIFQFNLYFSASFAFYFLFSYT